MPGEALGSAALTTLVALALTELHLEVVAGAAAWLAAWWLLREPGDRIRAGAPRASAPPPTPPTAGPTRG